VCGPASANGSMNPDGFSKDTPLTHKEESRIKSGEGMEKRSGSIICSLLCSGEVTGV
jgi:hypothetical protein